MVSIKELYLNGLYVIVLTAIFSEQCISNDVLDNEDDWYFIERGAPKSSDTMATLTQLFSPPDDTATTTTIAATTTSTTDYKFDVRSSQNIFYQMPYRELAKAARKNSNAYETLLHRHYQCLPEYFYINSFVSKVLDKIVKKDISTLTLEEKFLLIRMRTTLSRKQPFIDLLRKEADEDHNSDAQFLLGYIYYNAYCGLQEDKVEAVKWYRLSVDQGQPGAQFSLGLMYRDEEGGLQKDGAEAVRLLTLSAHQGYARAQSSIGYIYDTGTQGVQKDENEAVRYYKLSASQGFSVGMNNLATMYQKGSGGLEKDEVEAIKLVSQAALQRHTKSLENLKKLNQEQAFLVTVKLALEGHRASKEELQLKIIPSPQEEYLFPEEDFKAVYDVFTSFEGETLYWSRILGAGMGEMCGANPVFKKLTKGICNEIALYRTILDACKVPGTLVTCLTTDDIVPPDELSGEISSLPPLFYDIRGTSYISVTNAPVDRLVTEGQQAKGMTQISETFFKLNQLLLQSYQLLFEHKQKGRPRELLEIISGALRMTGSDLRYFIDSYLIKFPKEVSIEEESVHLDKILKHIEETLQKNRVIEGTLDNMIRKLINIMELTTEYRNLNFIKKIIITK